MNGAYAHLVINHIPVVGFPLCFLLLTIGLIRQSRDIIQAGLLGIVLMAVLTAPVFLTGSPAAQVARGLEGVTHELIHEHAEAGEAAGVAGGVVGVIALVGWWFSRRPQGAPVWLLALVLLGVLMVSAGMAKTAHLGGLIRHPEIEMKGQPQ